MKIITIQIGGRSFNVNCPEGQEAALTHATEQLAIRFNEIQQNAPNVPFDQALVLAGLNSIVSSQQKNDGQQEQIDSAIKRMKRMVELFDNLVYAETD